MGLLLNHQIPRIRIFQISGSYELNLKHWGQDLLILITNRRPLSFNGSTAVARAISGVVP